MTSERLWQLLMLMVVAIGFYFRLKGLGDWPLAVDEFYVARSIENIVKTGLPMFDCGGYYTRGILYQYLIAPLVAGGVQMEIALRLVSVLFNLLALPAAYYLAKRVGSIPAACAVVILMSLSIWESEFARFGRMYAPFQTLFLWYLVVLYRAVVDRHGPSQVLRFPISLIGPLIWEGGVFLVLLNFIPPNFTFRKQDWKQILAALVSFALVYVYLTTNFRTLGAEIAVPANVPLPDSQSGLSLDAVILLRYMFAQPIGWLVLLPMGGFLVWTAKVVLSDTLLTWIQRIGLWLALLAVLLNQFGLTLIIVIMLVLFQAPAFKAFWRPSWKMFLTAVSIGLITWLVYGLGSQAWHSHFASMGSADIYRKLFVVLFKFPNVFDSVIFKWVGVIPVYTLILGAFMAIGVAIHIVRDEQSRDPGMQLLLLVAVVMIVAVALINTKYTSTRYSFFLLPLLLVIASTTLWGLIDRLHFNSRRWKSLVFLVGLCALIWSAEDFDVSHWSQMDSREYNFRTIYDEDVAEHYYTRRDVRSPAQYVNQNRQPGDLVITTELSIGYYLDQLDYVYRDHRHGEFVAITCQRGQIERWTNASLIYREKDFMDLLKQTKRTVWLMMYADTQFEFERSVQKVFARSVVFTGPDQRFQVYRITPSMDG